MISPARARIHAQKLARTVLVGLLALGAGTCRVDKFTAPRDAGGSPDGAPPGDARVDAGAGSCNGDGTCEAASGESCCNCLIDCGSCGFCGDGLCQKTAACGAGTAETCDSCATDCGSCCGDGTCDAAGGETCTTCPNDCILDCVSCGDDVCSTLATPPETCTDCAADCGGSCPSCGDGVCNAGETCGTCASDCGSCCGDGMCDASLGEYCGNCIGDCGGCVICNDGICSPSEDCASCAVDCGSCCGNGTCEAKSMETCATCPADCGSCCGNSTCEVSIGETCGSCALDCGACCGNGTCQAALGETCGTCPADCGMCCGNGTCDSASGEDCGNCPADCASCCGNGTCQPALGESCTSCTADCGACPTTCPNGACDGTETCANCPQDCGACCGNGMCQATYGEDCANCTADCGSCCGNTVCGPGESCSNCPADCHTCGDGCCSVAAGESCGTCAPDCGSCCPNGTCDTALGETCSTCSSDCGSCCGNGTCAGTETCSNCPADCGACCGNGACDFGENCATCPADCGGCCGVMGCQGTLGENCANCPGDCGTCCGNGMCQTLLGENHCNCSADCPAESCGDGCCSAGESSCSCSTDCGANACGNGCCGGSENTCNCPADCGANACGSDGCCAAAGENTCTCPADCGTSGGDGCCSGGEGACSDPACPGTCCGAFGCEPGEDSCNCPADCGPNVCGAGGCCAAAGENTCTCPTDCGTSPSDGCCSGGETACNDASCGSACGDGCCTAGEDACNCAAAPFGGGDCYPTCGNAVCECYEDYWCGCNNDCGYFCCPHVLVHDGNAFAYESTVGGASLVGRPTHAKEGRDIDFAPLWIRLDAAPPPAAGAPGSVRAMISAAEDEIVYVDEAHVTLVDHPPGYEVLSSSSAHWPMLKATDPRTFSAVRTAGLRTPERATWLAGTEPGAASLDVTAAMATLDFHAAAFDPATDDVYELDFGEVRDPAHALLIVDGALTKAVRDLPATVEHAFPYLEVERADGTWEKVMSLAWPRGDRKALAFDLAGVPWPTGRYRMRVHTGTNAEGTASWKIDRARLAEEPALAVAGRDVPLARAVLSFDTNPTAADGPAKVGDVVTGAIPLSDELRTWGAFTRYGDVRALLGAADDRLVVMRHGDALALRADGLPPPAPGTERTLFLETELLFKPRVCAGCDGPSDVSENVAPLPFHGMGHYPPGPGAHPADEAGRARSVKAWDTRVYLPGDPRWGP